MKHILKISYLLCYSLLILSITYSCQKKETEIPQNANPQKITVTISDGLYDKWHNRDTIMLLHDTQFIINEIEEFDNSYGLSKLIDVVLSNNIPLYGAYPAKSVIKSNNKVLTVSIPSEQTSGKSGYDTNATITVAHTTSELLNFYAIYGGIKLNFRTEGITKIELESVDGYALSGTGIIKWDNLGKPIVDEITNANSILVLNAPDNTGFSPGKDYYICTLPCDLYGGYRLSIYKNGLVAHYFGVHQTIKRAEYIIPKDLIENELEFNDPNLPFVEEERPDLDATTTALLRQYRQYPTEENKQMLLNQMRIRYDKVVARKKAKLRELEREAKTPNLVVEMQIIVDEMVENRDIRLEQQFLRLIDPRTDDNPNDNWMVLRGADAPNAYIGYAPITNAEYALFNTNFIYDKGKDDYPVVNISIDEANAYCNWLTANDKSHVYRLPTDEEWILGAGHMPKDVIINSGHIEAGLTSVYAYSQTTGACGGIDFWGNCWEWTLSKDTNGTYIIKGGSWDSDRDDCRSEKSDVTRVGEKGYANVGFRVVRTDVNP